MPKSSKEWFEGFEAERDGKSIGENLYRAGCIILRGWTEWRVGWRESQRRRISDDVDRIFGADNA